jgi:hypothetical protein
VPASPSPPRVLLPTTCLQDLSHSALVEQANAYHEELRRRTHRQSSTVLRSAFQAAQIGRQQ